METTNRFIDLANYIDLANLAPLLVKHRSERVASEDDREAMEIFGAERRHYKDFTLR